MTIEIEREWRARVLFKNFNNKFDIFNIRSGKMSIIQLFFYHKRSLNNSIHRIQTKNLLKI